MVSPWASLPRLQKLVIWFALEASDEKPSPSGDEISPEIEHVYPKLPYEYLKGAACSKPSCLMCQIRGGVYLPQRIERSFLPFYGSSGEQYSRQAFVKKGWSNDLEVVGVFTVQFLSAFPSCSRILKDAPFIIVLSLSFSVPSTILAIVLICTVIFMPSMWKEM